MKLVLLSFLLSFSSIADSKKCSWDKVELMRGYYSYDRNDNKFYDYSYLPEKWGRERYPVDKLVVNAISKDSVFDKVEISYQENQKKVKVREYDLILDGKYLRVDGFKFEEFINFTLKPNSKLMISLMINRRIKCYFELDILYNDVEH